jgi:hypothetical protein
LKSNARFFTVDKQRALLLAGNAVKKTSLVACFGGWVEAKTRLPALA